MNIHEYQNKLTKGNSKGFFFPFIQQKNKLKMFTCPRNDAS